MINPLFPISPNIPFSGNSLSQINTGIHTDIVFLGEYPAAYEAGCLAAHIKYKPD